MWRCSTLTSDLLVHRTAYGKRYKFDASRAERELGIKWVPAKKAIQDMAAALLEMVRCTFRRHEINLTHKLARCTNPCCE